MDVMAADRKVWTALETRALIALKEEMKPKFQTMKRNRALWIELSDKLRKHFGHDRTASQCAVRWKNIMSSYKDSRDALKNPGPDRKVCSFFKEVEAVLGDPPLEIPGLSPVSPADPMRLDDLQADPHAAAAAAAVAAQAAAAEAGSGPAVAAVRGAYTASRPPRRAEVISLIADMRTSVDAQFAELRTIVQSHAAAVDRLEKILLSRLGGEQPPAREGVQAAEPAEDGADESAQHAQPLSEPQGVGLLSVNAPVAPISIPHGTEPGEGEVAVQSRAAADTHVGDVQASDVDANVVEGEGDVRTAMETIRSLPMGSVESEALHRPRHEPEAAATAQAPSETEAETQAQSEGQGRLQSSNVDAAAAAMAAAMAAVASVASETREAHATAEGTRAVQEGVQNDDVEGVEVPPDVQNGVQEGMQNGISEAITERADAVVAARENAETEATEVVDEAVGTAVHVVPETETESEHIVEVEVARVVEADGEQEIGVGGDVEEPAAKRPRIEIRLNG